MRKTLDFSCHQIHDIIGGPHSINRVDVPTPSRFVVETQLTLLVQRAQEHPRKEWVTTGFAVYTVSQRLGRLGTPTQCISNNVIYAFNIERLKIDFTHCCAGLTYLFEHRSQRMSCIHFIVSVGTDYQQSVHLNSGYPTLKQANASNTCPL